MEGQCSWIVREIIAEEIIADAKDNGDERRFEMCHPESV
jgi:hypothetical protein